MQSLLRSTLLIASLALISCDDPQAIDPRFEEISAIFESERIVATFVVESADGESTFVYNDSRSTERFSPASTFKIPNTLIALDNQVAESEHSMFKWDGIDKGMPQWNQDHSLASAFSVSCVWCFQEVARKVGKPGYDKALAALDYGNQSIGSEIDSFWLNGDLQISAVEQVEFLRKLSDHTVPFRREHMVILRNIMLVDRNDERSIYAKTGWAATTPQVAWYVGFVTKGDETWLFAMNMRVDRPEQAALRTELTLRSLGVLGILEFSVPMS